MLDLGTTAVSHLEVCGTCSICGPKLVPCHTPVCSVAFTPLCLCHPIYMHRVETFSSCSREQGVLEAGTHPLSCCSY